MATDDARDGDPAGWSRDEVVFVLLAGLFVLLSRHAVVPRYLIDWDAAEFAAALHRFDVTWQQPHPPGFPLFVAFGRLAYALVRDEGAALSLVSTLASAATVPVLYALGRRWFEPRAAQVWTIWWATQPLFWYYGALPLTYPCEALAGLGLVWWWSRGWSWVAPTPGLPVDRLGPAPSPTLPVDGEGVPLRPPARGGTTGGAAREARPPNPLLLGAGFGLAGGLRPSVLLILGPLYLLTLRRYPAAGRVASLLGAAGGIIAWLWPTVDLSGGWHDYRLASQVMSRGFFTSASVLGGNWAGSLAHLTKLGGVLSEQFGPGLVLMAAGLALWVAERRRWPAAVAGWWLTGGLGYCVLFHMGQPGYLLAFLPPLGLLLVTVARRALAGHQRLSWRGSGGLLVMALLAAWNLTAFLAGNGPASLAAIRRHDAAWAHTVTAVRTGFRPDQDWLLSYDRFRQAARLLPEFHHLILTDLYRQPDRFPPGSLRPHTAWRGDVSPPRWFWPDGGDGPVIIPAGVRRLVVIDPPLLWVYSGDAPLQAMDEQRGPWWLEVEPGAVIVHGYGSWRVAPP